MDDDVLEMAAFVTASKYRRLVVERLLTGPHQPSQIADEAELARSHVSRALTELEDKSLAASHGSDSRATLYTLTDLGRATADQLSLNDDDQD